MSEKQTLPDMNFIRREIPIADVARELSIRFATRNTAHCWRVGAHKNGDRTPSMSFHRNRAKCHVCDADWMSVIDLVIQHEEFELRQATDWICARWPVPTIEKNTKLSRPARWATSPVGLSSFPLERFIRSGVWASLNDAGRAVLPVLFCFAETNDVCVSYRALARYAGKASDATIAKALRQFKQLGILEALPKAGNGFRDAGRYRLTLDSPEFQAALSEVHAHLKLESGAERELRAQRRETFLSPKKHNNAQALYPGTSTVFSNCSVEQRSHYTVVKCEGSDGAGEKGPVINKPGAENKAVWQTPHFIVVKCEVVLADKVARSTATARRWPEIARKRSR